VNINNVFKLQIKIFLRASIQVLRIIIEINHNEHLIFIQDLY